VDGKRVLRAGCVALVAGAVFAGSIIALPEPASADKAANARIAPGTTYHYTSKRPTSASGSGAAWLTPDPLDCEGTPPYSATCDVFYITAERDETPDAVNFVIAKLNWEARAQTPPVAAVVLALSLGPVPDYNMYLWEQNPNKSWKRRDDVTSGTGASDMLAWTAQRDDYAVTVQNINGASLGFDFTLEMSNEKFSPPFELLDPAAKDASASTPPPVDLSDSAVAAQPTASFDPGVAAPSLATNVIAAPPAAVAADTDFTGFRGAVDDSLTGNLASLSRPTASAPVPVKAPAWALVIFWLLVAPLLVAALLAWFIRRRRPVALSS
jgi:hypothetical protein